MQKSFPSVLSLYLLIVQIAEIRMASSTPQPRGVTQAVSLRGMDLIGSARGYPESAERVTCASGVQDHRWG